MALRGTQFVLSFLFSCVSISNSLYNMTCFPSVGVFGKINLLLKYSILILLKFNCDQYIIVRYLLLWLHLHLFLNLIHPNLKTSFCCYERLTSRIINTDKRHMKYLGWANNLDSGVKMWKMVLDHL